jgi:hypothetical protein
MPESAERDNWYDHAAVQMALSHPAEAERCFGLVHTRSCRLTMNSVFRLASIRWFAVSTTAEERCRNEIGI